MTNSLTPTMTRRCCSISHCCRAADCGDLALEPAVLEPPHHAADALDLGEQRLGLRLELVGERLDVVGAAQRVEHVRHARLVGEHLLRAQRHLHRLPRSGSASVSSIELVCSDCVPPSTAASAWYATRTTLFIGCCAVSVTPAVCEWKRISHERRALRAVPLLHVPRPDAPRGAQLRDLLEEVVVDVPEEREPRREVVDVETARDAALDVREPVGERERELLRGGGAGFADVVAGDRDRYSTAARASRPTRSSRR